MYNPNHKSGRCHTHTHTHTLTYIVKKISLVLFYQLQHIEFQHSPSDNLVISDTYLTCFKYFIYPCAQIFMVLCLIKPKENFTLLIKHHVVHQFYAIITHLSMFKYPDRLVIATTHKLPSSWSIIYSCHC